MAVEVRQVEQEEVDALGMLAVEGLLQLAVEGHTDETQFQQIGEEVFTRLLDIGKWRDALLMLPSCQDQCRDGLRRNAAAVPNELDRLGVVDVAADVRRGPGLAHVFGARDARRHRSLRRQPPGNEVTGVASSGTCEACFNRSAAPRS